jgi:F-type H+-transporting ATPase subunit a
MPLALDTPPISHLVNWPAIAFKGQWFELNKIGLLAILSSVITLTLFFIAGSKRKLVPTGVQNLIESSIEFIRDGIIMETMGNDGMMWLPLLTTMFFFILFCNLFEIVPFIQMPATARMAIPAFLAVMVWLCFNAVGIMKQGIGHYFKNSLFPPGVPKALAPLVALIELFSTFFVRPLSLAIRLFANLLAGHILLITVSAFCIAFIEANFVGAKVAVVIPFVALVLLTGFELLVAFLQAYIFTILTAVYIGGAIHPEH